VLEARLVKTVVRAGDQTIASVTTNHTHAARNREDLIRNLRTEVAQNPDFWPSRSIYPFPVTRKPRSPFGDLRSVGPRPSCRPKSTSCMHDNTIAGSTAANAGNNLGYFSDDGDDLRTHDIILGTDNTVTSMNKGGFDAPEFSAG
jgi:hypothetical protein